MKKITKEKMRKIAAGARRAVDVEMGIGLNTHYTISSNKKKVRNKTKCRDRNNLDD